MKPVTRVFTAMGTAKLVRINGTPPVVYENFKFPLINVAPFRLVSDPTSSQVARGDKLKLAYQMSI